MKVYCVCGYSTLDDAEGHPAGISLHDKHSQRVAAPLEKGNGKLSSQCDQNNMLTQGNVSAVNKLSRLERISIYCSTFICM